MPATASRPGARPPRRSATRLGAWAALAAVALALPAGARAANRTFAINSLIIPVQIEYQEDQAVIAAYGLVYSVLRRNPDRIAAGQKPVTFYWTIAPNKLSQYRCNTNTNDLPRYDGYNDNDGCDFAVQSATGSPVALFKPDATNKSPFGTSANEYVYHTAYTVSGGPDRGTTYLVDASKTVVKYLGGAWVVDATDRQAFIDMLSQYPELAQYRTLGSATYLRIHSAQTSFTAPVARTLNNRPPLIAVANTTGSAFLTDVLTQAGLDQIPNWNAAPPNGQVYELIDAGTNQIATSLSELFSSNVTFLGSTWPHGYINSGRYGLAWLPDPGASGFTLSADQVSNLSRFVDWGNGAYVEASSIDGVENPGDYQTPTGVGGVNPNIAYYEDCNDRASSVGFYRSTKTGTCFQYGGNSQPYGQTGNFAFEGGQGNYKGFQPLTSFLAGVDQVLTMVQSAGNQTLTSARYKDNDTTKGLIFYMAGHKFENARYWGQRLIMDSVISNVPLVVGVELSRSEPVGYVDTSASSAVNHVYQGTYVQYPDPSSRDKDTYNVNAPQRWKFPYTPGHLYEYNLSRISTGLNGQNFSANSNWDAGARMPLPRSRRVFTVLGGSAQLGWKNVNWRFDQTGSACAKDAAGNCLLSAALAACGTAGVTTGTLLPANDTTTAGQAQQNHLGMFVQQVRGFCSAHVSQDVTQAPIFEPSDSQCDDDRQPNTASLGGVDHGSAALVGPSRYVTDSPWNKRPVVAYVGARDGMLHAIYVSGGSSFGTVEGQTLPSGILPGTELWAFVPPAQICGTGTGGLFSNDAMVDASVNVIDVFGNFPNDRNDDGVIDWTGSSDPNVDERPTGKKTWRTVLLAAVGQGGSELFALDVTNPLKPVLLWHVAGPTEHDGRWDFNSDGNFTDAGDVFDPANPRTYAVKWVESTDSSGLSAVNGVSQVKTGRFDYSNLGLAYGTAVGKLWEGNAFTYVAYVSTSTADYTNPDTPLGYKGMDVFAIDLVTGQKLWQWERRYALVNASGVVVADNTIPGRPALADVDADGSVDRVYVGDMEGHLWELEAHAGGNMNYLQSKDSKPPPNQKYYSFPLFGTPRMTGTGTATDGTVADASTKALYTLASGGMAQQPLTSPVGLGRFTAVPSTPTTLATYFPNRLSVLQGTMGVDWAIAPFEKGNLFVLPVYWESPSRIAYWYLSATPQPDLDIGVSLDPRAFGIIKPEAQWQIALQVGERIFGMPRVVNNEVVFNTAFGSFTGDISNSILDKGNLYIVKSGGTGTEQIPSKAFGGVLVFQNTLVMTTATGIKAKAAPADMGGAGVNQAPFNRASPAVFKTWEPPGSATRPQ